MDIEHIYFITLTGFMICFLFFDRDFLCTRSLRVDINEDGLVRLYFPKSALRFLFVLFAANWLFLTLRFASVPIGELDKVTTPMLILYFFQIFTFTSLCYKVAKRGRPKGNELIQVGSDQQERSDEPSERNAGTDDVAKVSRE
jgi:hypothetical protein